MHLRETLFQSGNQIEVVLERQVRMQPAHNVELGHSFRVSGGGSLISLFERHGVSAGSILLASKSAKPAGSYTDVGGIDMAIHIEISHIAVQPFTHLVGEPANRQDVR